MARVYLETSFFSACVSDRTDAASVYRRDRSREWWTTQRTDHELFVSEEVLGELGRPEYRLRGLALEMTVGLRLLALTDEVRGLARILVRELVMPGPEGAGDALHVSISTVHGIEYLATWNVRHLANTNKVEHLRVICRRVGYLPPTIVTPDILWGPSKGDEP